MYGSDENTDLALRVCARRNRCASGVGLRSDSRYVRAAPLFHQAQRAALAVRPFRARRGRSAV